MKKRLLCMALMLIMIVSALLLAGCSKEEETTEDTSNDGAKTITMWIVSEQKVSAEDEKLVETAFSEVTKSKFKVNVDIKFFTEDEYYEKLEASMVKLEEKQALMLECEELLDEAIADAKKKGNSNKDAVKEQFFKDHPEYASIKNEMMNYSGDDEEGGQAVQEDETVINEDYGIPEIKYPEAKENQVDIIYLAGYDKYISYINKEWLAPLDEYFEGVANKLTSYISASLLQGVQIDMMTYAIPNNIEIGQYTYMLLDKELVDSYPLDYMKVSSVVDCKNFIDDMLEYEPGVLPIAGSYQQCMDLLVWYWNIGYTSEVKTLLEEKTDEDGNVVKDENGNIVYVPVLGEATDSKGNILEDENGNIIYEPITYTQYTYDYLSGNNKFNMVGVVYPSADKTGRGNMNMSFTNLLANEEYRDILLTLKYYEYNNCYGTPAEGQKAAISFTEGSYAIKAEADANFGVYTDENGNSYYPIIVKYPQAQEDDFYGSMFAVSSFSENIAESMQIITELNTTSTLKNILQYGVEGEHYKYQTSDPTKSPVQRLEGCKYIMDMNKTGNCFLGYPEEGYPIDYWDNVKVQNNDAVVDPLMGFDFNRILQEMTFDESSPEKLDNMLLDNINGLSAEIWAKVESCQTYEELEVLMYGTTLNVAECLMTLYGPDVEKPQYGNVSIDLTKYLDGNWAEREDADPSMMGYPPFDIYKEWSTGLGYWVGSAE